MARKKKTCTKCCETKYLSEFYKDRSRPDGHCGWCKNCQFEHQREYQKTLAGKQVQARACKKYNQSEKGKQAQKKYDQSENGKQRHVRACNKYWDSFPKKKIANTIFNHAVRDGKIIPQPCVMCGETQCIQGHHEDYSQPLCVVWMCRKHHTEYHALLRAWRD